MDYFHAGFVLTNRYNKDQTAAVLDMNVLNDMGIPKIREINEEAFHLPREMLNLEGAAKKNMERKLGEALCFGDMIDFHIRRTRGDGSLDSFDRIRPFFESRVYGGTGQILMEGVVNPNDPGHLWTPYFRNLEIPRELQDHVEPNIFVEVWISLELSENDNLSYSLHSFHRVCDRSKQIDINLTPWNIENDRYDIVQFGETDGFSADTGEHDLNREEAYMTGPRSFFLPRLPQYKCIMAIRHKDMKMQIGAMYLLNCMWNGYERRYLVLNAVLKKDGKTLQADAASQQLRCSVHAHEDYLGLFYQKDTGKDPSLFGIIDDPNGVLALLHLSKIKNNAIPVSLSDPGPNRCGQLRFRIEKVMGDKKEKLEKFAQEEIILKSSGIVIDEDHVFSARHTPLLFLFGPSEVVPPPGTRVHFDATYSRECQKFVITSWTRNTEVDTLKVVRRRLVTAQPRKKQFAFNVMVKICPTRTLNKMFYSDDFGLLDDNFEFIEIDQNNRAAQYDVWVKRSEIDVYDSQPRTVFHIIGEGKKETKDRVEAPVETEEAKEMRMQFEETVRKAAGQPTDSRFSAPKTRSQAPTPASEDPAQQSSTSSRVQTPNSEDIKSKEQPKLVEDWSVEEPTITFERLSAPSKPVDEPTATTWSDAPSSSTYSSPSRFSAPSVKTDAPVSRFSAPETKATTSFTPESQQNHCPPSVQTRGNEDSRPVSRFSAPGMNKCPQRFPEADTRRNFNRMNMDRPPSQSSAFGRRDNLQESQSRLKRQYPTYTGAVRLPVGSGTIFDVTETLGRLNSHIRHGPACKQQCSSNCPNLWEHMNLFQVPGFFTETRTLFPQFVHEMANRLPKAEDTVS